MDDDVGFNYTVARFYVRSVQNFLETDHAFLDNFEEEANLLHLGADSSDLHLQHDSVLWVVHSNEQLRETGGEGRGVFFSDGSQFLGFR